MPLHWKILLAYLSIVSLISIIVCIYDKKISKRGNVRLRVPEKSLFLWSLLGGSVAMYITMRLIRHKTKHKSFMLGIPAIIILPAALMGVLIYYGILPLCCSPLIEEARNR